MLTVRELEMHAMLSGAPVVAAERRVLAFMTFPSTTTVRLSFPVFWTILPSVWSAAKAATNRVFSVHAFRPTAFASLWSMGTAQLVRRPVMRTRNVPFSTLILLFKSHPTDDV